MSWSIQKRFGKPDKMKAVVEQDFDNAAKNYSGQIEERDVIAAKAIVTSFLDDAAKPGNLADDEGVAVEASGSRGTGTWSYVTVAVKCERLKLHT